MAGVLGMDSISMTCVVVIILVILLFVVVLPRMGVRPSGNLYTRKEHFGDKLFRKYWCAHPLRATNCDGMRKFKSMYPSAKDGACWSACVMDDPDTIESFGDRRYQRDGCANETRGKTCADYEKYKTTTPPNGKDILCWSSCAMPEKEDYKKY